MLVVPGSMRVRFQAEKEGLNEVFTQAGAEWRSAGCSMCLGMNPDQLAPGERSASTSNRQLRGPPVARAAAPTWCPRWSPPPPPCAAPSPHPKTLD